jgi:hypothetical protein
VQPHKVRKLVYNGAMPLPATLVASIVSAIIEAAVQSSTTVTQRYDYYVINRTLPPEAKLGVMQPPAGDGQIIISGNVLPLAPTVQFRSEQNLIVMPMTIQEKKTVVFLADASGAIFRVWMINPSELSALPKN